MIFLAAMATGVNWLENNVAHSRLWIAGGFAAFAMSGTALDPTFPGDRWASVGMGLAVFAFYATLFHLDLIFAGIGRVIKRAVKPGRTQLSSFATAIFSASSAA